MNHHDDSFDSFGSSDSDAPLVLPAPRRFHAGDLVLATLAWLVILAFIVFKLASPMGGESKQEVQEGSDFTFDLQSRYLVGAAQIQGGANKQAFMHQLPADGNLSEGKRLRVAVLAGELGGPSAAQQRLQGDWNNHSNKTEDILFRLYSDYRDQKWTAPSVTPEEKQTLRKRLGWYGDLALAPPEDPDQAARMAALAPARRTFFTVIGIFVAALALLGLGAIALLALLVAWVTGSIRAGISTTHSHAPIWIQTFTLYMLLFFGMSLAISFMRLSTAQRLRISGPIALISLAALAWPRLRGMSWAQIRNDIGWTAGRGLWREILAGPLTYIMALPLAGIGVGITLLLMAISRHASGGQGPSAPVHPVAPLLADASLGFKLILLIFAAVIAPIVEETMFRGVLYRHLREGSRHFGGAASFLLSAVITSFIFASIHPQGWLGIPPLMGIAHSAHHRAGVARHADSFHDRPWNEQLHCAHIRDLGSGIDSRDIRAPKRPTWRSLMRTLALLLLCSATSFAAPKPDFYVSPAGKDSWSGKLAGGNAAGTDGPFRTLSRARDAVRALRGKQKLDRPIVVGIVGSLYELSEPFVLTPADSGTEKSPTIFMAIAGDRRPVIISGGIVLRSGGPERYPLPDAIGNRTFRHISVNGEFRHRSRLPKTGAYVIAGLAGADPKGKYNTPANKFEFKPGEIDANWKNLHEVEAVVLHFWVDTHLKVKSVDAKKRVVEFDRYSKRHFTDDYQNRLARYYLTNVFEALGPGEFYHDRKTNVLHYKPLPGETPGRTQIIVPRLDSVIRFEGHPEKNQFVEWIEFRGVTVSDASWEPPAKDAIDAQAASIVPGAIRFRGARHCSFDDGVVKNVDGYGIEMGDGCRDLRLVGNEITHTGAGGIKLTGGDSRSPANRRTGGCVITDNHLHHLGEIFHSGVGVLLMHADHNTIAHNHIHHLYYTGISVGWVWGYGPSVSRDNKIEYNHIHDVGQKFLSDMGGIYTLGVSPGTVLRGNVIHDVDSWTYGGWGIYPDEGSTGILIENNLVYRTKSGGFHQHYGKENIVRNNIFALAREGQIIRSRAEPHLSFTFERNIVYWKDGPLFGSVWNDNKFVIDHNLYWKSGKPIDFPGGSLATWQKRGHDKHSIIADPHFRDPEHGDFSFTDERNAKKIGFVPFDASKAGVREKPRR